MKIYKKTKALLSLLLCFIFVFTALPSFGEAVNPIDTSEKNIEFISDIIDYVKSNYPFEVTDEDIINNAVKGILQGLDPYSDYYTKEEADELLNSITGNFVGIGIHISKRDDYIEVISTIKNSPAEKAGLKSGDLIVSIDGIDVKNIDLEDASTLIKGIEGTTVNLDILREGKTLKFNIQREFIIYNPVNHEILEENIGYIKIFEFNIYTTKYVREALDEFDNKEIKKIIIDIRNNPGGLLNQAISISRLFVPEGEILHVMKKNEPLRTYYSTLKNQRYELVVLVNENSASASEIFAGAVKDRGAGTLIGTKTYGKGIIQSMQQLPDGSLVTMTIAQYLTPNKTFIHQKGIEPDIKVENTTNKDQQLQKAIQLLKNN